MRRNLESLKHALDMWKRGQLLEDRLLIEEGARAVRFWRGLEADLQYKSKVTSEGTK